MTPKPFHCHINLPYLDIYSAWKIFVTIQKDASTIERMPSVIDGGALNVLNQDFIKKKNSLPLDFYVRHKGKSIARWRSFARMIQKDTPSKKFRLYKFNDYLACSSNVNALSCRQNWRRCSYFHTPSS